MHLPSFQNVVISKWKKVVLHGLEAQTAFFSFQPVNKSAIFMIDRNIALEVKNHGVITGFVFGQLINQSTYSSHSYAN